MKKWIPLFIIIVLVGGVVSFVVYSNARPGKYDTLAQCINKSGATFYGAWWCPHCAAEKADFGKSAKLLPYVECQTADQKQTQACTDAQIEGYPTWVIPKPIVIQSDKAPQICHARSSGDTKNDPAICAQAGSQYRGVWIFAGMPPVLSLTAPTTKGNVWTFPAYSRFTGEVQPSLLAQSTDCPLQ